MLKLLSLFAICFLIVTSCDLVNEACYKDDCFVEKPERDTIIVQVTIEDVQREVEVRFYEDNLEEENIKRDYMVTNEVEQFLVKEGAEYLVEARYERDGNTIAAVDEASLSYETQGDCDIECHLRERDNPDLRLTSD